MGRKAFTLVELMVVIAVIGILATLTLMAMFGAQELAKANKTQSTIAKLNEAIMPMYERYRDRTVPVNASSIVVDAAGNAQNTPPQVVIARGWGPAYSSGTNAQKKHILARAILDAKRELMRMELPDRWDDVIDPPLSGISRPAASVSYLNFYTSRGGSSTITNTHQSAECLYLIVSMYGEDGLELFADSDAADTDGDGAREFVDGWGKPIHFLRWPVGFDSPIHRIAQGAVTNGLSTTSFEANTQMSAAHGIFNGQIVRFTTGRLRGQLGPVLTYTTLDNPGDDPNNPNTPKNRRVFEFPPSGFTEPPAAGDRFVVMPRDSLDVARIYPTTFPAPSQPYWSFDVVPLIMSAGPDGIFDITGAIEISPGTPFHYGSPALMNNPYYAKMESSPMSGGGSIDLPVQIGTPRNVEDAGDGLPGDMPEEHLDNITNHDLTRR